MKIAITKCTGDPKYEKYAPWLAAAGQGVETVDLSENSDAEALAILQIVDGIVFTGGSDINPSRYGREDAIGVCSSIDRERDAREFTWFAYAQEHGIPILAICRGMQLANIALGGTMISDISSLLPSSLEHSSTTGDVWHNIVIDPSSLLATGTLRYRVEVNSSHHQAVDMVAPELRVTAYATDGIVEIIEWKDSAGKPFFLGVQWHPERMPPNDPLSCTIANVFLQAVAESL